MSLKYQLKIINNPFDSSDHFERRKIYGEMLALRLEGYYHIHGNVIPIDQYDLFSTHIVLYRNEADNFQRPIACTKITTLKHCIDHQYIFPPINLMKDKPKSLKEIKLLMDEQIDQGLDIAHISSFTVSPNVHQIGDYMSVVKYILTTTFLYAHANQCNKFLLTGTQKVKTDKMFARFGLVRITDDDNAICNIPLVNNEPAVMFKYDKNLFSSQGKIATNADDVTLLWASKEEYI